MKKIWFKLSYKFKQKRKKGVLFVFTNILAGIANLFANSVSSACIFMFFDEPKADKDLL